jgi:hypothetical protein
MLLPTV